MGKKLKQKKALLKQAKESNENKRRQNYEEPEFIQLPEGAKSGVKALGVKSVFAVSDEIIMTSFGRGNDAVLEKLIKGTHQSDFSGSTGAFKINPKEKSKIIEVVKSVPKNKEIKADAEKPSEIKGEDGVGLPGNDAIRCRRKLEEKYFGCQFDDNIHIQLIYNILDIEKILAVYSNNIIYALNNIASPNPEEIKDFLGNISSRFRFDDYGYNKEQKNSMLEYVRNPRLSYFGNTFYRTNEENKEKIKPEKEVYDILALMGSLRQLSFHDESNGLKETGWLYNLNAVLADEFKDVLDSVYETDVNNSLRGFLSNSGVNLNIIHGVLWQLGFMPETEQFAVDFYNFKILKKQKNLGFSLRKLREEIISNPAAEFLKGKAYDKVRHKLYSIIDFVLYFIYIHDENNRVDKIVSKLRMSFTEQEKDRIYMDEAKYMLEKYMLKVIKSEYISDLNKDSIYKNVKISDDAAAALKDAVKVSTDVSYFSKLIYLACKFLNGKEINDLITTLISKFDNIRSYLDTLEELKINCKFADEFVFFKDSGRIVSELNEIKSFARMVKPLGKAKKLMYIDAMIILGTDKKAEDLNKEADFILGINEEGKIDKKKPKDFRNFIAKNVINSNRFHYLIKYANPRTISKLAENKKITDFVLKKLPDSQIDRYCESCHIDPLSVKTREEKLEQLAEIISNVDFSMFKDVKTNVNQLETEQEKAEADRKKEKYQTVISLYLTILYLIVKNLVNVNSRYVIAIHMLERDLLLNGIEDDVRKMNPALTELYVEKSGEADTADSSKICIRGKNARYIRKNMENVNKEIFNEYRNTIAHLEVIRYAYKYADDIGSFGSYFQLYHYIMQCLLYDKYEKKEWKKTIKIKPYLLKARQYKTYCKDCVRALNTPFAYNLARYKNLSTDEIFDKNDDRRKK